MSMAGHTLAGRSWILTLILTTLQKWVLNLLQNERQDTPTSMLVRRRRYTIHQGKNAVFFFQFPWVPMNLKCFIIYSFLRFSDAETETVETVLTAHQPSFYRLHFRFDCKSTIYPLISISQVFLCIFFWLKYMEHHSCFYHSIYMYTNKY